MLERLNSETQRRPPTTIRSIITLSNHLTALYIVAVCRFQGSHPAAGISMETGSSQPTVSGTARKCLLSFRECLGGVAALDPKRQSFLENELARFSLWTSNIGVFARSHASLDHRLRRVPSIQREIVGQLEKLHRCVEQCMYILFFEREALFFHSICFVFFH